MERIIDYSFKDSDPICTIKLVRGLFATLGIIAQESWKFVGKDVFSVHLAIFDSTLTANGKGSTKELALASAYGELAERLAFLLPFRVSPFYKRFYNLIEQISDKESLFIKMDFETWLKTDDAKKYFSMLQNNIYKYFSDEQSSTYSDFDFRWTMRKDLCQNYQLGTRFNLLSSTSNNSVGFSEELVIPYAVLDYYYGSNGMCAGNTEAEALVQGICEIIERYVQRRIILECDEEIYDITQSCIQQCENIKRTYTILANNGYKLKILECAPNGIAPVVSAILMKTDGKYYVSMGCHPCSVIAAERAVTELFQGYCIDDLEPAFEENFIAQQNVERAQMNYINLLKYGVGRYPANFILGRFPEKEIVMCEEVKMNSQLLTTLVKRIEKENLKVYVCKGLPLGLYCFHVLIIGISEAENILPSSKIRDKNFENSYSNLSKLTKEEAKKLADRVALLFESGSNTLEKLLDIDKYSVYTNCNTNIKGISAALFISMLYIKAEIWDSAANFLKIYIDELSRVRNLTHEDFEYYVVLKIILEEKSFGWTDSQIINTLSNISNVDALLDLVNGKDNIFINLPKLSPTDLLEENDLLKKTVENEEKILRTLLEGKTYVKET